MRLHALLVAAVLASLGAGCIGSPGQSMTFGDGLADATTIAERWAAGTAPKLVAAAAVEPFQHINTTDEEGRRSEYETRLDGNPGDGKAPGWLYGFVAGDRCIRVVLAAGLGVLADGYDTCDREDREPLPAWSVDSGKAAAILDGHSEWPRYGAAGTYAWDIEGHDGAAVWTVAASAPDHDTVIAVLNASSGEVLHIGPQRGWGGISSGPGGDAGSAASSGSAGQDGFTAVHDEAHAQVAGPLPAAAQVELKGRGGFITVRADVKASLGVVGSCELLLKGPDGTVVDQSFSGVGAAQDYQADFSGLPAGQYTLSIETTVGAALEANLYLDGGWS